MIDFELDMQVLGNTTFAFSPLAETASSLALLTAAAPNQVHRPWLAETRQRISRNPSRVDVELLSQVRPADSPWVASFLYPLVHSARTTIDDQLHTLSQLSADNLAEDLINVYPGRAWPPRLSELIDTGPEAGKVLAESLHSYWQTVIAPYWVRMVGVLEEDIAYRASQSLQHGLFELFSDIHPRISLTGNRLALDLPGHAAASYGRARLVLVPSIFIWPKLVLNHETPGEFEVTYGARGSARTWEGLARSTHRGEALESLLGRNRAAVLTVLTSPVSTTELARDLRLSPASVSRHLSVLRDSGLASSWRTGRIVLYQQTPLAASLIELNSPDPPDREPPHGSSGTARLPTGL